MNDDVTVLVCSCDKYEDAWEPFFRLFQIFHADKAFSSPIVLNTETKQYHNGSLNVQTINYPQKATWSQRLKYVLNQIDSEFVFLLLEDFFLQSEFNAEYFSKVMEYMRNNQDVGAMHMTPNGRFPADASEMFLERKFDKLNITITAVVWRRQFLLNLLRDHENIWQFEWYSTYRAKKHNPNVRIMQYNEKYPLIYHYFVKIEDGYGITESKWLPKNKELFEHYGISVNYERLGWYVPKGKNPDPINIKNFPRRVIKHLKTRYQVHKSLK